MGQISRREFVALAAAGASLAARRGAQTTLTAGDVVERVRQRIGGEWKAETIDTFKAGDPSTTVTGIVTTATPTRAVLERIVALRANLVITSGPTFYARADTPTPVRKGGAIPPAGSVLADPVFAAKADFIRTHNLVVWRFAEGWRARRPNPFTEGLADALGWTRGGNAEAPARVSIPATPLAALASDVKKRLDARGGVRVVGDPALQVQTVGLLPGSTPLQASLDLLPDVDVILAGEMREWEGVEYARDAVAAGGRKGLILIGRLVSEDPGMRVCAQWLGTVVPELRTTWIPAGDLYWRPV